MGIVFPNLAKVFLEGDPLLMLGWAPNSRRSRPHPAQRLQEQRCMAGKFFHTDPLARQQGYKLIALSGGRPQRIPKCRSAWLSTRLKCLRGTVHFYGVPCAICGPGQLRWSNLRRTRGHSTLVRSKVAVDNRELLTGDCLILISFCLYKQITAIILQPHFPGFLAPLKFNITRFGELASFSTTLTAAWVVSALLVGGYRASATADLPTALTRVSLAWLISMPVAACQLVLLTAAEDKALVGGDLFASVLPLAATGPGEPLATAAGVLGLMAVWRCFYTIFLDFFNARQWASGAQSDRYQDMNFFMDALKAAFLLAIGCIIILQFLSQNVGEEAIEKYLATASSLLP